MDNSTTAATQAFPNSTAVLLPESPSPSTDTATVDPSHTSIGRTQVIAIIASVAVGILVSIIVAILIARHSARKQKAEQRKRVPDMTAYGPSQSPGEASYSVWRAVGVESSSSESSASPKSNPSSPSAGGGANKSSPEPRRIVLWEIPPDRPSISDRGSPIPPAIPSISDGDSPIPPARPSISDRDSPLDIAHGLGSGDINVTDRPGLSPPQEEEEDNFGYIDVEAAIGKQVARKEYI
ncbi:MAG: hypothetical protein SGCHY_005626 [Lobulomycetales sp.]